MKVQIVVPQVGEAVAEVTLVKWYKKVGDPVKAGEPLFSLDTDKSVMDVEATDDGTLSEILAGDGSAVMPLAVVGTLDSGGQ